MGSEATCRKCMNHLLAKQFPHFIHFHTIHWLIFFFHSLPKKNNEFLHVFIYSLAWILNFKSFTVISNFTHLFLSPLLAHILPLFSLLSYNREPLLFCHRRARIGFPASLLTSPVGRRRRWWCIWSSRLLSPGQLPKGTQVYSPQHLHLHPHLCLTSITITSAFPSPFPLPVSHLYHHCYLSYFQPFPPPAANSVFTKPLSIFTGILNNNLYPPVHNHLEHLNSLITIHLPTWAPFCYSLYAFFFKFYTFCVLLHVPSSPTHLSVSLIPPAFIIFLLRIWYKTDFSFSLTLHITFTFVYRHLTWNPPLFFF